ncbi:MAG: hypothetical protein WDN10_05445 [bacterium]
MRTITMLFSPDGRYAQGEMNFSSAVTAALLFLGAVAYRLC